MESVEGVLTQAQRCRMLLLAFTNTNALSVAVLFSTAICARGITLLLGTELEAGDIRAIELARTNEGYIKLCRIITARKLSN